MCTRQRCTMGLCMQGEWDAEFYDGLWDCESAVGSGSCGAIGAGGDMLQENLMSWCKLY